MTKPLPRSNCRTCGRPIIWVVFASGKKNPLDANPDMTAGTVILTGELGDRGTPIAKVIGVNEARQYPGARYTSHFATCPNADTHRRHRTTPRPHVEPFGGRPQGFGHD